MLNKIVKEIIILLLLILIVILISAIFLYNYIPTNKVVPEKVSYITPEKVQEELKAEAEEGTTEVVMTYNIDSTDLNNYKKTQEYVPGKKNPFAALTKDDNTQSENSNQTGNKNTNSSTTTNKNTNTNSTNKNQVEDEGYLPNKGTK